MKKYILSLSVLLILFLVSCTQEKPKQTIFFKCGDPWQDNFCVELHPTNSRFASNTINSKLVSEGKPIMNCPVDGGTGSAFMNCVETIKSVGCQIIEADTDKGIFYTVAEC